MDEAAESEVTRVEDENKEEMGAEEKEEEDEENEEDEEDEEEEEDIARELNSLRFKANLAVPKNWKPLFMNACTAKKWSITKDLKIFFSLQDLVSLSVTVTSSLFVTR